jgi:serine protease AprX
MSRKLIIFILILFSFQFVEAQKYWVFFTDKKDVSFNPYSYFDEKAIERREKMGIPLNHYTDYPLNQDYVSQINKNVDTLFTQTRWFNAVSVYANQTQLDVIRAFPFVKEIKAIEGIPQYASYQTKDYDTTKLCDLDYLIKGQMDVMQAELFKEKGIDGSGLRIAIFDGGFPTVDVNPAFEHIRKDGRIIKTWDFTKNKENVYRSSSHGTMVLSCIAGIINGKQIGMATGAEFLLAKTEINREPFSEEENWLAALEWADKNGADIVNSSLGYTYHRYFPEDMDGKTAFVTRAANMAASKGILVCNAAGNEGTDAWEIIGAPADADSILSIGGIDPYSKMHINFSSYGPTADKRMKPNVCAYGLAVVAGKKKITSAYGTSFASPLVAGFVACAWQTMPESTNMEMFDKIQESGSLYPYFDYAHGYGVPQASFFVSENKQANQSFDLKMVGEKLQVILIDEPTGEENDYFYYNIMDKNGVIEKYTVLSVYKKEILEINISSLTSGNTVNFHYKGYTKSFEIE